MGSILRLGLLAAVCASACARPSEEAPPPAPAEVAPVIQWAVPATKMLQVAFFFEKELPSREATQLARRKFCQPLSVRFDPALKVGQEFVVESYRANLNAESMYELKKKITKVSAKHDTVEAELEVLRYASRAQKGFDVAKLKKAEQKCKRAPKGGGNELECSKVSLDQFIGDAAPVKEEDIFSNEANGRVDCSVDRVFSREPRAIPKYNLGKYEMPDGKTHPGVRLETETSVRVRCFHQTHASRDAQLIFEGEGVEKTTEIFSNAVISPDFQSGCAPKLYEAREVLMHDGKMIEGSVTRIKQAP